MNETKLATMSVRMQYWADTIRDRSESGLTVDQYCLEHGLSRHKYFYWLRKIREAALDASGVSFVEITPPAKQLDNSSTSVFDTEAMISIGNISVSVNSKTSNELLPRILEVVRDVK